ncbi:hypothetical protein FA15DRAFT_668551 [Coprinopsis marcescibilis]|uniref:G-protein coupled receptors family 3 profile domain-containing protein n=1 Tax=Coprinopsis marcescibilis TaxID=230819 RepID=A0A5C3KYH1_COPMA|nr:hypothetical protein FA15DRAFT_668551 [Coprinopsis marcescibilis]
MSSYSGLFTAFITLQLFGLFGCLIIFITALAVKSVPRQTIWFSFVLSWFLSTISYVLLFISGHATNPEPPYALCLTQASLIYASPVMTSATTLALVLQVYFNVKNQFSNVEIRGQRMTMRVLLGVPYLMYLAMFLGCLGAGLLIPGTVQKDPNRFYCNLVTRIPSRISSITVATLMVPTTGLAVATFWLLKGNWSSLKESITRVLAFSVIGLMAMALGVVFASISGREPELNMILATVPALVVIVFGTQKDLIDAWMFWRQKKHSSTGVDDAECTSNSRTRLVLTSVQTAP